MSRRTILSLAVVSCVTSAASAQFSNFTPLPSSAGPIPVGSPLESTPISLSNAAWSQQSLADRTNQNTLVPGSNSGNWDMIDTNRTGPDAGRYLFMPFETGSAGVQRIDLQDPNYNTRTVTIVAPGTQSFVSGDASRWTPWGGYLTAEESWGTGSTKGRLFEVTNPTAAGANGGTFVQRTVVPRVSHEGLAFDSAKNMYFVDELNGGTIYKYVPTNPNATDGNTYFASGQTFALRVGAGGQNENSVLPTGAFSWQPITNATGGAIPGVSAVNGDGTIDGRVSADNAAVLSTAFNRPEDMDIQIVNGEERIYFATTDVASGGGTGRVWNMNLSTNQLSLFADGASTNLLGGSVGSAFSNPDNIAIDNDGNIYIVEDRNGGVDDDIWFAKDLNKDGDLLDAGEGLGRWASNGTQGSEFTGLYFDFFDNNRAFVNIQHPTSGNDRTIAITVPEPTCISLLGLAAAGLLRRRR